MLSQIGAHNSQPAAQVANGASQTQVTQPAQTSQGAAQVQAAQSAQAQAAQQPPLTVTDPVTQSAPPNTIIKPLEEPTE